MTVKSFSMRLTHAEWKAVEAGLRLLPGVGAPEALRKITAANEVLATIKEEDDDDDKSGPAGGGSDGNGSGGEPVSCVPDLSRRESLILQSLTLGESNKAIARKLVITESTVKVHMKAILRKLRLGNRTQAAMWARTNLNGEIHPNGN